jgi:hypothetical protein
MTGELKKLNNRQEGLKSTGYAHSFRKLVEHLQAVRNSCGKPEWKEYRETFRRHPVHATLRRS